MPYFSGIIRGLRQGLGPRRRGRTLLLKIKCAWVNACMFSFQIASLDYFALLDGIQLSSPLKSLDVIWSNFSAQATKCFLLYYYFCFHKSQGDFFPPIDDRDYYGSYSFFFSVLFLKKKNGVIFGADGGNTVPTGADCVSLPLTPHVL